MIPLLSLQTLLFFPLSLLAPRPPCKSSVLGFLLLGQETYPQKYPPGTFCTKAPNHLFLPIPLQFTTSLYSKLPVFSLSRFSDSDLVPLKPSYS